MQVSNRLWKLCRRCSSRCRSTCFKNQGSTNISKIRSDYSPLNGGGDKAEIELGGSLLKIHWLRLCFAKPSFMAKCLLLVPGLLFIFVQYFLNISYLIPSFAAILVLFIPRSMSLNIVISCALSSKLLELTLRLF